MTNPETTADQTLGPVGEVEVPEPLTEEQEQALQAEALEEMQNPSPPTLVIPEGSNPLFIPPTTPTAGPGGVAIDDDGIGEEIRTDQVTILRSDVIPGEGEPILISDRHVEE